MAARHQTKIQAHLACSLEIDRLQAHASYKAWSLAWPDDAPVAVGLLVLGLTRAPTAATPILA